MAHDKHDLDGDNKDVDPIGGILLSRSTYLGLAQDWLDPYGLPTVVAHENVRVVRDDFIVGTKARAADLLVSKMAEFVDTIVYVQPRVGLAGVSLIEVAKRHGKKVILFMPACKEISTIQACCIERGATPIFKRIAAMPNLNKAASEWADQNGAFFVPLGLRHQYATAALVSTAAYIPEPDHVWTAISTGVLSRALQIAWPHARFTGVAVARNIHAGEAGRAHIISEPLAFEQEEKPENMPPFPSMKTYDAKVWKYVHKAPGNLFWNVGKEPELMDSDIYKTIKSNVDWSGNLIE